MKTPSNESFHSTRSRQPSISGSPPPPETVSHMNPKPGVPLTTTLTTHNVGHLNNQCQTLGLSARYEIDGDQPIGFGGYLQLGPHTITRDERWPSKKAAREGLAQKGLAILMDLQRKKAEEEESVENWLGMLHSKRGNFRNQCYSISLCSDLCRHTQSSHLVFFFWPYLDFHQSFGQSGDSISPIFTEYTIGSLYACTCLISLHPTPFGSESVAFPSKKAARTSAAREAMEFLISLGYATSDGKPGPNIQQKKSPTPGASKRRKTGTKSGSSLDAIASVLNNIDAPFAQKVNGEYPCHFPKSGTWS